MRLLSRLLCIVSRVAAYLCACTRIVAGGWRGGGSEAGAKPNEHLGVRAHNIIKDSSVERV